jgi:hypothetical protein
MNTKKIGLALGALSILMAGPTVALADNSLASDPIVIRSSSVQFNDEVEGGGPGFVSVDFENTRTLVATEVVFALDANGAEVNRFDDKGMFAPGVPIRHAFLNSAFEQDVRLRIVRVKFADGSRWEPARVAVQDE